MSALIDFDGEGPVMTPGQLTSQISSLCCALMIVFFSMRSPIKTPPVIAMLLCCCCCSSSSTMKLIDDTMNRFMGKKEEGPSSA
mgnify:FL=1|jgi:hypothetical protein